jgi:hypothetical protein
MHWPLSLSQLAMLEKSQIPNNIPKDRKITYGKSSLRLQTSQGRKVARPVDRGQ